VNGGRGRSGLLIALALAGAAAVVTLNRQAPRQDRAPTPAAPVPPAAARGAATPPGETGGPQSPAAAAAVTGARDRHGAASALARDFWRADDYLAFVDRHLEAALAGDPEAQYFVAMAQQACAPGVAYPTLTGRPEAVDAWLARRPGLSDEQADVFRRRLERCGAFVQAYGSDGDAEALEEGAEALLRSAAAAGHPAARIELRMWSREGWRGGPARDAVLDDLAAAAASGHPEALRLLGDYVGGDAGIALTLLACEAGYDCAPDALWVVEYCQLSWTVCGIEADGSEALLASLPSYRANEIAARVAGLRGGSAAVFRRFLGAALAPGDGLRSE
jgi:hypothetical protein